MTGPPIGRRIHGRKQDYAVPALRPATRQECAARIMAEGSKPHMQAFLVLWWDIVAGAARGVPGYREAAQKMMAQQLVWLEQQMPASDPDPVGGARYMMTLIEGALMLGVVGHGDTALAGLHAGLLAGEPPPS
jgi:hypothetical protein